MITLENREILEKYRTTLPGVCNSVTCLCSSSLNKWLTSDKWSNNTYISYTDNLPYEKTYQEITDTQFKTHVLKTENMKNEKIIGYKFKENLLEKDSILKAVVSIGYIHSSRIVQKDIEGVVSKNSLVREHLETAGVLDLWFEPVYEPKFKVGDYVYIISSGYGTKGSNYVSKLYNKESAKNNCFEDRSFAVLDTDGAYCAIYYKAYRHATPQEIAKYKEEQSIKLPKIGGYDGEHLNGHLKWGCTSVGIPTIKELHSLGCTSLEFNIDFRVILVKESDFQQIVKYLKHRDKDLV